MYRALFVLFISILFCSLTYVGIRSVSAWYGAGKTIGVPATSQGLQAEAIDPFYSASPTTYLPNSTIPITIQVTNPTQQEASVSAYFRVYKVSQAPTGTDVSDGDPGETGLTEASLFSFYAANTSTQTLVSSNSVAPFSLPANTQVELSANLIPLEPGYYQFVFSTVNADVDPESGELLATGFIRVLNADIQVTPTPAATPTSTPSSTASPTPTASPTSNPSSTPQATSSPSPSPTAPPQLLNSGKQSILALSTPTCSNRNTTVTLRLLLDGKPRAGRLVKFEYAGEAKEAFTDVSGDASVVYGFKTASDVKATPSDGYPAQLSTMSDAVNCPASTTSPSSSPIPTTRTQGQVLGAYAETGLSKGDLFAYGLFGAVALMSVGLFLYGASLFFDETYEE